MPPNSPSEGQYFRELSASCESLLQLFGQEEVPGQEKQADESGVSEYRRKLEAKLEQFDNKLLGLIGDRTSER